MTTDDRLEALLCEFKNRRGQVITADDLAASYQISVRTVYRYINVLRKKHDIKAGAGIGFMLMGARND
jgi:predicted DNA-binding transcriptional regulator YafY